MRQAFELAIDRTALIQVVYNGMFTPTVQANPPSSPYYFQDLKPPARDVAKAKALLKQAGVPLPVPVTLTITNGSDIQQAGEVIQSMATRGRVRREAQDDGVRRHRCRRAMPAISRPT